MSRTSKLLSISIMSGLAVAPIPPVFGAEDEALLEEVIVTARKREERLQDLPGSAAALSSDFLKATGGINNLRDLTDLITGISIIETNTQFLTEPSIRGAGQSRNRASVSATGLYRNGAYFATNGLGGKNFSRMDSYDIQRVEVLRGPQGALYGRNALGGAINMISQRPGDEFDVEVGVAGDASDAKGLLRYDIRMDVPLDETVAVRVSHLREDYDEGYMRDINGNFIDDDDYNLTRISLRYQPQETLTFNYSFDTEDTSSYPATQSRTGSEAIRGFTQKEQNYFVNSPNSVDYQVDNHNLVVNYRMENGLLTSITNSRTRDLIMYQDTDHQLANTNVARTRQRTTFTDSRGDSFFQEVHYAADGNDNIKWLVGVDLYQVDYDEFIDTGVGQAFVTASTRDVRIDQDSWSVFGSVDYYVPNMPVMLSGEIRYANDKLDGSVLTLLPVLPASPVLEPAPGGGFIQTQFANAPSFSNLPYSLSASWNIDNNKMVYAKFANSYRHGGLNLNEGQVEDPYPVVLSYGEEYSDTLEFGLKSSWLDRRLTINSAAYYIWYDNFLDTATNGCNLDICVFYDPQTGESLGYAPDGTPIETDPDGNDGLAAGTAFYIDNVGEVEAWGLEVEATARLRLSDQGRLILNLGWSRQMGQVESINADASAAVQLLANAPLNRMRPKAIKGSAVYRQGFGITGGVFDNLTLVAGLTLTYESGGKINLATNATTLDRVERANARIGVEADKWSFMLRGSNITGEQYELWRSSNTGNYLRRINDPESWEAEFTWHLK